MKTASLPASVTSGNIKSFPPPPLLTSVGSSATLVLCCKNLLGQGILYRAVVDSVIIVLWDTCSPLRATDVLEESFVGLLTTCFHAVSLLGLFFEPEDESDMFFRNVC
jgi:hypothetical protein